jgi:hypothetical protein
VSYLTLNEIRRFLSKSISSLNKNKLNGILAEIDFRNYLISLGYQDRVSPGGWIVRSTGPSQFGHHTIAMFPETVNSNHDYSDKRHLPEPSVGLHTICATFHQIGIQSYFCAPVIQTADDASSLVWHFIQLGLPSVQSYRRFPFDLTGFIRRERRFNFLRYSTNVDTIPEQALPEQFSKEHIRVVFQNTFIAEISDIDGIFWGQQYTYPIEIKEKSAAEDRNLGQYFGLDLGPFVKLAYYAAKRGNLHSLFVVREIDNSESRALVNWWFITFERLAQFASWVPSGGGRNMLGGQSTVVKVPKAEFQILNAKSLSSL